MLETAIENLLDLHERDPGQIAAVVLVLESLLREAG